MPLLANTFTEMVQPAKLLSHLMDKSSLEGIESGREVEPLLTVVLLKRVELLPVLLSSQGVVLFKVALFFVCLALRSILFWIKLVELLLRLIDSLCLVIFVFFSLGFLQLFSLSFVESSLSNFRLLLIVSDHLFSVGFF